MKAGGPDEPWGARGALDPEAQRINFSWLVRLRWGAIAGQAIAIGCVHFGMGIALPLTWLAVILGVAIAYNLACAGYVVRARAVGEPMVAAAMAGDVLLLTALLFFTGGPLNPFSFLYLVHIALAAVVLRSWWTWSLVALSLLGFASLFVEYEPPGASSMAHGMHAGHDMHAMHGAHGGHDPGMDMHLQGMWVAFGIAAAFIVYFVSRVTRDLAAREAELAAARAAASRNEKLAALATLAAGAAHELATPLSTIAIAAKDLERSLSADQARAGGTLEDVQLIRDEVARCRRILQQMSVEAGQSAGESAVATQPEAIVALALEALPADAHIERVIESDASRLPLCLPEQALALALRGLLKNALEAVAGLERAAQRVTLRVALREGACVIEVHDAGAGMPPSVLARVGEPFFTTKAPGSGMGLGVFVARALCEQLGGKLEIDSAPGRGTTVSMHLPLAVEPRAARAVAPALEPA